jgi:hypothetical protein
MVHLFIHLLINANHKDKTWKGITVKRGQVLTGRKQISEATGISEQKIRTCIKRLKSTSEITNKSTNKYTIITLCNFDEYQNILTKDQPIDQPADAPTTNQQLTTTKNVKNEKEEKEESMIAVKQSKKDNLITPEMFADFWKMYPRKINKGYAFDCWSKLCKKTKKAGRPTWGQIRKAIIFQSKSERWQETEFIPHPSTWLNQFRWLDDPETMVVTKKKGNRNVRKGGVRTPEGFYDGIKVKKINL